jgi:hypothetical protein
MEYYWLYGLKPGRDQWNTFMQDVGSKKISDGYMEASAARTHQTNDTQTTESTENYLYIAPPQFIQRSDSTSEALHNQDDGNITSPVMLSYNQEIGWNQESTHIHGFTFTKCAYNGTCEIPDSLADERVQRALRYDFDFSQPVEDAVKQGGSFVSSYPQGILPSTTEATGAGYTQNVPTLLCQLSMTLVKEQRVAVSSRQQRPALQPCSTNNSMCKMLHGVLAVGSWIWLI